MFCLYKLCCYIKQWLYMFHRSSTIMATAGREWHFIGDVLWRHLRWWWRSSGTPRVTGQNCDLKIKESDLNFYTEYIPRKTSCLCVIEIIKVNKCKYIVNKYMMREGLLPCWNGFSLLLLWMCSNWIWTQFHITLAGALRHARGRKGLSKLWKSLLMKCKKSIDDMGAPCITPWIEDSIMYP